MKKALLIAAALAALTLTTAGSCSDSTQDKAKSDCLAKGGHYQKTGDHSGNCLPPAGGWQ